MARLLFILAEWPRPCLPLIALTSCLTYEPNSNDREYSQPFRHFQSNRIDGTHAGDYAAGPMLR